MDTQNPKNRLNLIRLIQKTIRATLRAKDNEETRKNKYVRWAKYSLLAIVVAHLIGIALNFLSFKYEFWDNDSDRGGITMNDALFNESHQVPEYLKQGWDSSESLWFYNTNQGSNLIPYDFYLSLEKAESKELFSSSKNIDRYRYLIRKKTHSNPDALPVGFAKDSYKGKDYLGFSCAACHTSQINYTDTKTKEKKAIRIDGGPSQANFQLFMTELSDSLGETYCEDASNSNETSDCDIEKQERFVQRVLARNDLKKALLGGRNYTSKKDVLKDLAKFSLRIQNYNWINRPDSHYGYSRLDAFGRIYNRVAEYVIDINTLERILSEFLEKEKVEHIIKIIEADENASLKVVEKATKLLSPEEREDFFKEAFTEANAPVSYPYLWDVPYHDYLQWNGSVNNAGAGALGRNVGQVIGVFGNLDWEKSDSFNITDVLVEKKSAIEDIDFHSSVNVRKLVRTEALLKKLKSPLWPEDKLGTIDRNFAIEGKKLYQKYCISCHADIDRSDKKRRITANFTKLEKIGTDPNMALNSVIKKGYSGFLKGNYANLPAGKILLQDKTPVALMVRSATENTLKTADIDTNILARWSDWIYDLFFVYLENPVEDTIKHGDYTPDTTNDPFASLRAYKARPLNGIWATAPYLHNGSVPTLYDLLLPAEQRPTEFKVGSRVFDPIKVGFKSKGYGVIKNSEAESETDFDTSFSGNHNTGHEYGVYELKDQERMQLLEYLKTL